ncbi:carbon storage regulator CsrA [Gimesia sp.]|uniref:carbon storage regulator CsrA n=1 Tax=Gimesia sp. TaxID=2024833 RepID=UPI0032F05EB4
MLVLSRSRDEKIFIGDNITVTVVDIRGDKVRLGIAAPTDIPVHREEVYEAIKQEQRLKAEQETDYERMWREWAENKGKPCQ